MIDAQQLMAQLLDYKKQTLPIAKLDCTAFIVFNDGKRYFENNEVVFFTRYERIRKWRLHGEISADMLQSIEADGSIIGHSERRQYHGETDSHCNRKVKLALDKGLTPIYCNGETLEQRKSWSTS